MSAPYDLWEKVGDAASSDDALIAELASLPPLEYEKRRGEAAKQIGCRASILDGLVREQRPQTESGASGNSVLFPDVEPWPKHVEGAALVEDIADLIRRYVVVPDHAETALALWIVFTHSVDVMEVAPILCLSSPEKRCGKTTLLTIITKLSARPLPAANISPAALFRSIEAWAPTLLIDEADTFVRDNPELNGVINSGHTRATAFVIRTVGDDFEPRRFSTWGAKAIALIGKLPETLHDRSVVVELRRALPGERREKLRHADPTQFAMLGRRLVRFVADHAGEIRGRKPMIPDGLNDRAADNWEPLLAIADVAGGAWPETARKAAVALSGTQADSKSLNQELLEDIRDIFERTGKDRIATAALIEELTRDDEMAWATYNRGQPIKPKQIANRLREFRISSQTIRIGNTTTKGYLRSSFSDAFARYIAGPAAANVTPSQPAPSKGFSDFPNVTSGDAVTDRNRRKPAPDKECDGVTDTDPLTGAGGDRVAGVPAWAESNGWGGI